MYHIFFIHSSVNSHLGCFHVLAIVNSAAMNWVMGTHVVLVVENSPANAGDLRDLGSIPGLGRSPGEGSGNTLQYSCLENPMDRGIWWAKVHGVAKGWT